MSTHFKQNKKATWLAYIKWSDSRLLYKWVVLGQIKLQYGSDISHNLALTYIGFGIIVRTGDIILL